jgi:hypothetical protein
VWRGRPRPRTREANERFVKSDIEINDVYGALKD